MKTNLMALALFAMLARAEAASTINSTERFGYAANVGWVDWRGDTNTGAVVGEYVCSGYLWAANAGWVHLGSNAPANGIRYQNNSPTDYGVNHDGLGNLRGYAYGANIGWLSFESNGAPRVDLLTGRLSGYVYSANCGWISLSNAFAQVRIDTLQPGTDIDGDGIADAWELLHFNNLTTANSSSDSDGDGQSDYAEYVADTDPGDFNSQLRIRSNSVAVGGANEIDTLVWNSQPTRQYRIQYRAGLGTNDSWLTYPFLFPPDPGPITSATISFGTILGQRYFRVQAVKPLSQ